MSDDAGKLTSLFRPAADGANNALPTTQLAQVLWFDGHGTEFFFQDEALGLQDVVFLNGTQGPTQTLSTPSVLERTGMAVVNWNDGDELRLYYQGAEGGAIFEQAFEEGQWSHQQLDLPAALPGTGLAAVTWNNGTQIRVYCQNPSGIVQEYDYSENSWKSDEIIGGLALKGSAIAALGWGNGQQLRLYFQGETGAICESVYMSNGGWQLPTTLLSLRNETGLAAVSWGGTTSGFAYVRLYYQAADRTVQDYCYNGGTAWTAGTLNVTNAQANTALCAVQLNNGNTIRVTYQLEGGGFGEAVWNGTAWAYHSQTG